MNICYVEQGYPAKSFGGGAGTYVQLAAKELIKRGHKVFVISKYLDGEPAELVDDGVIVRRVKIEGRHWYFSKVPIIGRLLARFFRIIEASLVINREIKEIHRKYKLDFMELTESANFLYGVYIRLPYVVHLHGSSFTFKKYCGEKITLEDKMQRRLEGFVIKRARFITSPSRFLRDEIIREFSIDTSKICVIPYPIDEKLVTVRSQDNKEQKIVFYAGRLEERKGVHILKEAIPLVLKKYQNVVFMLFGLDSKNITRNSLEEYFKEHGVSEKVKIYSFTPKKKLFEYLSQADICVVPSIWDNSPNTVYEAMAAGKAIVATNVGGIPELINNGVEGILVEPANPGYLSQAIVDLLKDDNKRKQMGQATQKKATEKFNINSIIGQKLTIYSRIMAGL